MRLLAAPLAVLTCCSALAADALEVAISKRIPCETDTVKLSAHLPDWAAPDPAATVLFSAECDGLERPIGKTHLAAEAIRPFDPCIEWSPGRNGLYRILARIEGTQTSGKLLVPVVVQDVYFCWYGQTRPEVRWMTHHLTAAESEIPELHARGVVALKHSKGVHYLGGTRWEDIRADVDWEKLGAEIVRDYTEVEPYDGIAIDELGMWDDHPEQTRLALGFWEALKRARAAAPGKFFATWQFAALTPLECNLFRDTVDLIMCEVYQNHFRAWYDQHNLRDYIRQRIDMARAMMVLKKTVIGLAISTTYGGVEPEELEDQVRFIRATGPEMRGLAFFTTSNCTDEVLTRADDCCYRYWVRPAVALLSQADLTLTDYQPQAHGVVRLRATVHNVGGMDARNVLLRFYDGDPAYGGAQIGADQLIPRLPAARWVDPQARDDRSIEPAETMRAHGFGMITVSVPWRATAGAHDLWVEIVPSADYTTIRGFESRRVSVR